MSAVGRMPGALAAPDQAWSRAIGSAPPAAGRSKVAHEASIDDGPWGGVPLGGLGSGSIGRTPRGDFARWHLESGVHRFESIPACQFSVFTSRLDGTSAHALSTIRPDADTLGTWSWDLPVGAGRYRALFPYAWFEYDWAAIPVRLTQRQFSPVLPGNYRESSHPVGLFEWLVENPGRDEVTVSLMFTWQNLVGHWNGADASGGHRNRAVRIDGLAGVVLAGPAEADGQPWNGTFAIATPEGDGLDVTTTAQFDARDGADVWAAFAADGRLRAVEEVPGGPGRPIAAAIAVRFDLAPGEQRIVPFALAWDFPTVEFGSGRRWARRHTREFGTTGRSAWAIAAHGLAGRETWAAEIDAWQGPVLDDPDRPAWYKAALFNELYFMVDGGTFWADHEADGSPADPVGPFGLIECFDYPFYNTLDVYFYASFALVRLWPELARRIIRDFVATVGVSDPEVVPVWATGGEAVRKVAGALPHDVGGPQEDPFVKLNTYHLQDVNVWKDLNCKFVLLVWQAVALLEDEDLCHRAWTAVVSALHYLAAFDRDGDGLIEHDGVPDQTYDTWPMRGPSAYGGSLWLASLRAGIEMGERVGDSTTVAWLRGLLDRALPAFDEKLWNGTAYRYDAGGDPSSDSVMADQLAGQWWADATGLGGIAPDDHVRTALRTIFERNVLGFGDGRMGAVNGTRPDGSVDTSSEQSQEVWAGTTYALAAFMAGRGMMAEAWATAAGVDRVVDERGYQFRTPEAYDITGNFRASLYLRPLAIWAIEHALRPVRG